MAKRKSRPVDYSGLANVELRADIEKYMPDNPLARLGWSATDYGKEVIRLFNNPNRSIGLAAYRELWPLDERPIEDPKSKKLYRQAIKEGMDPDAMKSVLYSDLSPEVAAEKGFKPKPVKGETTQETVRRQGFQTLVHELMHKGLWDSGTRGSQHHPYIYYTYERPRLDAASTPKAIKESKNVEILLQKASDKIKEGKPNAMVSQNFEGHKITGRAQYLVDIMTGPQKDHLYQKKAEKILAGRGVPTARMKEPSYLTQLFRLLGNIKLPSSPYRGVPMEDSNE